MDDDPHRDKWELLVPLLSVCRLVPVPGGRRWWHGVFGGVLRTTVFTPDLTQLWRFGNRRAQRAEIFGTLLDTLDTDFSRFRTPPRTDFSPGRTKNHYESYL